MLSFSQMLSWEFAEGCCPFHLCTAGAMDTNCQALTTHDGRCSKRNSDKIKLCAPWPVGSVSVEDSYFPLQLRSNMYSYATVFASSMCCLGLRHVHGTQATRRDQHVRQFEETRLQITGDKQGIVTHRSDSLFCH